MVLSIIDGWSGNIFDTKVSLLQGEFEEDTEHIYMELPGGFEKFFRPQVILWFLCTIYDVVHPNIHPSISFSGT